MKHFDAIIIGTGQAGPSLAARFASAGKTVAIIEPHKFGGTCVNTGCIPTKTLVASAYAAHIARTAGDFGVSTGEVQNCADRFGSINATVIADANAGPLRR